MGNLDPELDVAGAAMVREGARFVVVGGFAVIANRFVRATEDIDFLAPDDDENDRRILAALRALDGTRHRDDVPLRDEHLIGQTHLRAGTTAGIVDIIRASPGCRLRGRHLQSCWSGKHRRLQATCRSPTRP